MNAQKHGEVANFIWGICNLLRGPYKRNEYRKVILPLTALRRFDCVLAETKEAVLAPVRGTRATARTSDSSLWHQRDPNRRGSFRPRVKSASSLEG